MDDLPYDKVPITKDTIDAYKREWKKHGFPDVDHGVAHTLHSLNDPVSQPSQEALLWSCVLSEAFVDVERGRIMGCSKRKRRDADDTEAWFAATTSEPGDFEWVCDVLGLDVGYVRGKLADGAKVMRVGRRYNVVANPHGRSKGMSV